MSGALRAAAPDYPAHNNAAVQTIAWNVIAARARQRTRVKTMARQEAATDYFAGVVGGCSLGYSFECISSY